MYLPLPLRAPFYLCRDPGRADELPLFRELSADGTLGVIGGVNVDVEIAGAGNEFCSNVFVDGYAGYGRHIGGERYYGWPSDADSASVDVGHGQSIEMSAGERVAELACS